MTNKTIVDYRNDPLIKGPCAIVAYAQRENGKRPAMEYIEGLGRSEWAKLAKSFMKIAHVGKIHNRERFRKLRGKIYEFKVYPKVRILCFQLGKTWLLTHGFGKQTGDTPPRQIERAEAIMKEHISLLK